LAALGGRPARPVLRPALTPIVELPKCCIAAQFSYYLHFLNIAAFYGNALADNAHSYAGHFFNGPSCEFNQLLINDEDY
jgi:hypothetical protein